MYVFFMVIVLAGFRTVKVRFCYLIVRILSKYCCIFWEKSEFCFSTDDVACTSAKHAKFAVVCKFGVFKFYVFGTAKTIN